MHAPRIYIDTSVLGGCLEPRFAAESKKLMELVGQGRVRAVLSEVTLEELERAPAAVRGIVAELPPAHVERVVGDDESLLLARGYVAWDVLTQRSWNDARHLAIATRARVDALASWNFRDIVNAHRMRGFNAVNLTMGYGLITIVSPQGISEAAEYAE